MAEVQTAGGRAIANGHSVASWDGAQATVQVAVDALGRIDAVIAVHLEGTFNISRTAAPLFKEQLSGGYVHMSSTSGLIGNLGRQLHGCA